MVKMVQQLISNFKVVGSTPTTLFEIFYFFIHKFMHDVSPAVVEACLKNSYCSMAQSKGTLMVQCHPRIQDLNPCPCQALLYKLNCVWCRVELKVVGNLECRIKFYRKKKSRHFFYTIEYPSPPTNSVGKHTRKLDRGRDYTYRGKDQTVEGLQIWRV